MNLRFDSKIHHYYITTNGVERPVPSVTQVIRAILGDAIWQSSEWHLQRGQAVHAAAAMIVQGKRFEYDSQIEGQVSACRLFFKEIAPIVVGVEQRGYSAAYQFAGTCDLLAIINKKLCILDWKSALSGISEIQLGGYGILFPSATHGMVVALRDDGKYKTSGIIKLDRRKQEFLALRSVYAIRQRLGLEIKQEVDNGGE